MFSRYMFTGCCQKAHQDDFLDVYEVVTKLHLVYVYQPMNREENHDLIDCDTYGQGILPTSCRYNTPKPPPRPPAQFLVNQSEITRYEWHHAHRARVLIRPLRQRLDSNLSIEQCFVVTIGTNPDRRQGAHAGDYNLSTAGRQKRREVRMNLM